MRSSVLEFDAQREEIVAEVAILIYEQGLTQQQVADRIGVSRSTVSRLLDKAQREGIVQIYINTPFGRSLELQTQLCKRFGLKEARVLVSDSLTYDEMLQRLGMSAAFYLRGLLKENMRVGIAWGAALHKLVKAFRPFERSSGISVVQMIGSIGALNQDLVGADLGHDFAELVHGRYYDLLAPLVVETAQLREALMQQRDIADVLALARHADVALVGIGSAATGVPTPARAGYLSEEDLRQLREANAVGDICGQYFDIHGQVVPIDLNRRVVGITLSDLKEIPLVVGIAGGREKILAILGALRGGLYQCFDNRQRGGCPVTLGG